jgi:enamine deaminase RidA (YjgF/YER057c/UK114 family)
MNTAESSDWPEVTPRVRVPTSARWADTVGYSRAVLAGDTIHVSGTLAVGEDGRIAHPGDPYGQTRRCLEIIVAALRQLGASPEHVVRTRVYVRNIDDWEAVGGAHGEVFGDTRPATTLIAVADLADPDALVEIEAFAAR